jgi:hypothetical protein
MQELADDLDWVDVIPPCFDDPPQIVGNKIMIVVNPVLPVHADLLKAHARMRRELGLEHANYWHKHPESRFADCREYHLSLDAQVLLALDV